MAAGDFINGYQLEVGYVFSECGQAVKKEFLSACYWLVFSLTVIAFCLVAFYPTDVVFESFVFGNVNGFSFYSFVLLAIGLLALIWSLWSLKEVPLGKYDAWCY